MEVTTIEGLIQAPQQRRSPHADTAERADAGVFLEQTPHAAELQNPLSERYTPVDVAILTGLGWNVNITA